MRANLRHIWQMWQYFGPSWLGYRLKYAVAMRSGRIRHQLPPVAWDDLAWSTFLADKSLATPALYLAYRQQNAPTFFFSPGDQSRFRSLLGQWETAAEGSPEVLADAVLRGDFRYFEYSMAHLGFPPAWNFNPFTEQSTPDNSHWSQISDFGHGDIKVIWEPSRFGFVYALVRAYWRSGDEKYAEGFWQLVEDWKKNNPPQQGANWKCGQETSLRVVACCFALYGFLNSPSTTAERVVALGQMIAVSGERIEANLQYAMSQRNNHAITEAMGLWTIGLLFPELRKAASWKAKGYQLLEQLGRELIYEDGSFVQHSVNYHRLMLDAYLWAIRLGDLHDQPFSDGLKERLYSAATFLYQLQDETSGKVPYYGQNDGALLLPLSRCDYQDFRPVLQATHYLLGGAGCHNPGPWNEVLLWLFGEEALECPTTQVARTNLRADVGGYYTIRTETGFGFIRCATFRDRPGQADMLHFDLWWRGQNIALDPGTYSYNAPSPWNNPLAHTAYHNTIVVDDLDQMDRVGKFMWLPWLRSKVRYVGTSQNFIRYWEGEHDGYHRLPVPVTHYRSIVGLGDATWLIVDRLRSKAPHRYRLHWLCPDVEHEWDNDRATLTLRTSAGDYHLQLATSSKVDVSLVRADPDSARGWRAPYYYHREPALSLCLTTTDASTTLYTLFSPHPCHIAVGGHQVQLRALSWQGVVELSDFQNPQQPVVTSVTISGSIEDRLEVSSCTPF